MKRRIIRLLLAALNSRWLNQSPCSYGYINNIDAFSLSNLESEEQQRPGISVRTVLEEAARFRSCPMGTGLTVIEGDEIREGTLWDIHELRQSLSPPKK